MPESPRCSSNRSNLGLFAVMFWPLPLIVSCCLGSFKKLVIVAYTARLDDDQQITESGKGKGAGEGGGALLQRIQTEGGSAEGQNRLSVYYRQVRVLVPAVAKVIQSFCPKYFFFLILSLFLLLASYFF